MYIYIYISPCLATQVLFAMSSSGTCQGFAQLDLGLPLLFVMVVFDHQSLHKQEYNWRVKKGLE